jgi:hypothetical protein
MTRDMLRSKIMTKVRMNYERKCIICGTDKKLHYKYGDFNKFGIQGNIGFLVCKTHDEQLMDETKMVMEAVRERTQ